MQTNQVASRANGKIAQLNRLMAEERWSINEQKKAYFHPFSTILYFTSVCIKVLRIRKYKNIIETINRRFDIPITCAYRMASTRTGLVLAGLPLRLSPFDLRNTEESGHAEDRHY